MGKHTSAYFSGYCPELNKSMDIRVDFEEIRPLGERMIYYKKTGYSCEHGSWNGCNSNGDDGGECPIFKSANM